MKSAIPPPESLIDDLLEILEEIDQEEETDSRYISYFSQIVSALSTEQRALIDRDHFKAEEARAASQKYYSSALTDFIDFEVFKALQNDDSNALEFIVLPPALADALQRLDQAGPRATINVFQCGHCKLGPVVLLPADADAFSYQCPACGNLGRQ